MYNLQVINIFVQIIVCLNDVHQKSKWNIKISNSCCISYIYIYIYEDTIDMVHRELKLYQLVKVRELSGIDGVADEQISIITV